MIDHIDAHPDGSITIFERTQEGKMLGVTYPPEAAHAELVRRGAKCHHEHRVKTTPTTFRVIETDDLSDATRAEVDAVGTPVVTDLREDRDALRKLREEFDIAWEARVVVMDDIADIETRNDRIDALDQRMKELRETIAIWEACIAIADMDEALEDEG